MKKGILIFVLIILGLLYIKPIDNDLRFKDKRLKMVRNQIEARGINHAGVLKAMREVLRHLFVPEKYLDYAYDDGPLPIGYNQTISQPYIVALMTASIKPKKDQRILEVGTGSGYQAAVLSRIVKEVYSVEIIPELYKRSCELFKKLGYKNIKVRFKDGYQGWKEFTPFDGIIVTCAPGFIPQVLIKQLKIGGKMCIPVGPPNKVQSLLLITKTTEHKYKTQIITQVRFVPMVKGELDQSERVNVP